MEAEFGANYNNVRTYLATTAALTAEGITPTTPDTSAIETGSVPPSLLSDATHLNAAGYRRKARGVYEKIKALGYNDMWGTLGDDADVEIPVVIAADDFNRVSANIINSPAPIGSHNWQILSGGSATVPLTDGALGIALNTDTAALPFLAVGRDVRVVAKLRALGSGSRPRLVVRMESANDHVSIDPIPGQWQIRSFAGGTPTVLGSNLGVASDTDEIEFEAIGTTGTLSINGVQVWTGTIPDGPNKTRVGFLFYTDNNTSLWDDLKIYVP